MQHDVLSMIFSTPSQAQIVLAMILLKSRPARFSIEEYVQQLRSVIVPRVRTAAIDRQQYIDASLFWKQAYEKSELEVCELQDRIFKCEQVDEGIDILAVTTTNGRKRKFDGSIKANTQTKRSKAAIKSTDVNPNENVAGQPTSFSTGCGVLLRAAYNLRIAFENKQTAPGLLCQFIMAVCHGAEQCLDSLSQALSNQQQQFVGIAGYDKFSDLLIRCWTILVGALQKAGESNESSRARCIPPIVNLFQHLLGQIQQASLDEADQRVKSKKKHKMRAPPLTDNWKEICSILSHICCQMLDALDMSVCAHATAFRGMICVLLDHIGSSISLLIFAERGQAMSKQAGLLPPRGLLDVAHLDSTTALLTSQIASPYLVLILRRAKSVLEDARMRQQRNSACSNSSTHILHGIREKLQATLLRGVFGDEDVTFKDALDRAVVADREEVEEVSRLSEQEQEKSAWFVGQVWELIGWDMLAAK